MIRVLFVCLGNICRSPMAEAVFIHIMEYASQTGVTEVPDPYYTGGFPEVYRLIDVATDGLLAAIHVEWGL